MANDTMLGSVYIVMALVLVVGALIARREKAARLVTMAIAWVAIFGAGFILFTFRDDLGMVFQRIRAEATGEPVQMAEEIRVPMALDGHFWVDAELNGQPVKFLVDSGATMTTIGRETANRAGVILNPAQSEMVRTGNGVIRVSGARVDSLQLGPIEREGMRLHVADTDGINVLGMNFLSSLQRWGVEGRWLILVP